ncbi:enoyl-CoA hydratase, partial [Pseudoalteromonas sp. S4389]|uniref:enoyl-CoA hydratase-related protein n=1 Tax=Pseudoalteromonas sp. S4389 TaxID=579556 RepID=UPI001289EA5C
MIKLEINQQVAWVSLARPEKQNALSFAMFVELANVIKKIKRGRSLRAGVISGKG